MDFPFKRVISSVLIVGQFSLLFTSISSYAASNNIPQQLGNQDAYSLQRNIMNDLNNTTVTGNTINFGNQKVQAAVNRTGGALNKNDLTPATSGNYDTQKYYVNKKAPTTADMQATYALPDAGIEMLSEEKKNNMDQELEGNNATLESQAYSTIAKVGRNKQSIDANDPIFNRANNVITTLKSNPFEDCEIDKQIISMTQNQHVPDLKECVDVKVGKSCVLTHEINPVIAVTTGVIGDGTKGVQYSTCRDGRANCISIGLGKKSSKHEDMKTGNCTTGTVETTIAIGNKEAIKKAVIATVRFAGSAEGGFKSAKGNVHPIFSHQEGCTANSTGKNYLVGGEGGYDVTGVLKRTNTNVQTFYINYTGAVPDVQMEVDYDPSTIVGDDLWEDSACADLADKIHKGELKGSIQCTDYTGSWPKENEDATHVYLHGVLIEKKYLSSYAGLPSNCTKANVVVKGGVEDEEGNELSLPTCKELEEQKCSKSADICTKYNEKNECVLYKHQYDCGTETKTVVNTTKETYDCPGPISCSGIDCVNIMIGDTTEDFAKATGLLQMSQQGTDDVDCSFSGNTATLDPDLPLDQQGSVSCTLWKGEAKSCKIFYSNGGLGSAGNDCCHTQTPTTDVRKYIRGLANSFKLNGVKDAVNNGDYSNLSIGKAGATGIINIGWNAFLNYTGVTQKFTEFSDKMNKPVVDALNNIIPYAGEVFAGALQFAEQLIINAIGEYIAEMIISLVEKLIGNAVTGAMASVSSAIASSAAGRMIGQAMAYIVPVIGWIYAIYKGVQVIINLATMCHDEDFELQNDVHFYKCDLVNKWCSMKNTAHIGGFVGSCLQYTENYCCFTSPLSRILNKQVRYAQRGCPNLYPYALPMCAFFFTKETPWCAGITLQEIQNIDWKKIDLTEWLQILTITGNLPNEMSNYGLGVDSALPIGGYDQYGNKHDINNQHSASSSFQ